MANEEPAPLTTHLADLKSARGDADKTAPSSAEDTPSSSMQTSPPRDKGFASWPKRRTKNKRKDGKSRIKVFMLAAEDVPASLPRQVPTKCYNCGTSAPLINSPRWTKQDPPRLYVAPANNKRKCCGKWSIAVPQDDSIPHITNPMIHHELDLLERKTGVET